LRQRRLPAGGFVRQGQAAYQLYSKSAAAAQTALLENDKGDRNMSLNLSIGPLASLIAGILILVVPRLLNYIVALYLIIMGVVGLAGMGSMHI
jgi:DUF3096 family protein